MRRILIKYFVSVAVFLIIDIPWIIFVVNPLYEKHIGSLLRDEVSLFPAVLFYLIIVAALLKLTDGLKGISASIYAFGLGFVSYATYSLTNMSVLQGWSWEMVVSDMIWGGVLLLLTYHISKLILGEREAAQEPTVAQELED